VTTPSIWRRVRNTLSRSQRKRRATIDITNEGFILTLRTRESPMRWSDVTQIDVGVRDYLTYDTLYVLMFAGIQILELDELDDGFRQFENTLFERWPEIRGPWNALLSGNPREPKRETLWRHDGAH